MDKFLDTHDLSKLNQEYLSNLNRSITSNEIENSIQQSPRKKLPGLDEFTTEFYQTIK
jgi:hypothetical protein